MSLDALIMLAGALIAATPFLGFPVSWDRILYSILGTLVVILGIVVRRRTGKQDTLPRAETFSESAPRESHDS